MVPRAADGVANDKAVDERSFVVCAVRADGEAFLPLPHQQHLGIADFADKLAGFFEIGDWNPACQVRSVVGFGLGHMFDLTAMALPSG
jgi:hypothetical protein